MLLAVDIGNSNIVFGIFKQDKLIKRFRIVTAMSASGIGNEVKKNLIRWEGHAKSIEPALISSVVPQKSGLLIRILKEMGIRPLLLGKDIKVPIKNLYRNPMQVGQDRLVNAYACLKLYGRPAIIVDFGTATTFDYLDEKGAYAGGLITPGVEISLDALAERTALLPRIQLKKPRRLIGKDTVESIRSGVLYGLASLCDGVIEKIKGTSRKKIITVATGGLAPFFSPYCKYIDHIDPDLTLKGINLIYADKSL